MRNKKFILDPNIYISYFITGRYNYLLKVMLEYKIFFIICPELLNEIERVLQYPRLAKFGVDIKRALRFVNENGYLVNLQFPIKAYIPGDNNDDYLIALALQQSAGFVCSGDQHILNEKTQLKKKFTKLEIITKKEFEHMFPITE